MIVPQYLHLVGNEKLGCRLNAWQCGHLTLLLGVILPSIKIDLLHPQQIIEDFCMILNINKLKCELPKFDLK